MYSQKPVLKILPPISKGMRNLFCILFILLVALPSLAQTKDPFLYGRAAMDKGQYSQAIRIFGDGLRPGAENYDVLLNIGECYFQAGDYRSAIHYFLLAESKKKNIASIWLARSYAMTS